MYQLLKAINPDMQVKSIKRTLDNAVIPFDPANTDYQAYLAWLDEGGVPLPADEPTDEV